MPGPDNLLDGFYGLGPECHGGDCLGPAGAVDLGDPGNIEGNERQGLDRRRGAGTDLLYPRNLRGDGAHECGGGVRGPAAGYIDPHAVEGGGLHAQDDAGLHLFQPEVAGALAFVEALDPGMGLDQGSR